MNLDKLIAPSTVTITPNNRLQQALVTKLIGSSGVDNKDSFIEHPNVYSLSEFIQKCWGIMQNHNLHCATKKYLLTSHSAQMQWVKTIREDNSLETIMSVTELANEANSADRKATLWCCDNTESSSIEEWTFLKWRQKVKQIRSDCLTEDEAIPHIIEALKDNIFDKECKFCLFSFDDIPPLHQQLFEALNQYCYVFEESFSAELPASPFVLTSYDKEQQWLNVANWCVKKLKTAPETKIAIVSPELTKDKDKIISALDTAFEPQVILPNTPTYTPPYNVSAGTPLIQVPLIKAAYLILSCANSEVDIKQVLSVIKSPFIGQSQSEMASRAIYDVFVREQGKTRLTLLDLIGYGQCPPELMNIVGAFANVVANKPISTSLMNWASFFENALNAIGWPGERNLDSIEFQAMSQFIEHVCSMTQHFQGESDMGYEDALFYLYTTLTNNTFSAESADSPIEVLGLLEASGMPFDVIVVLDMNEGSVPCVPSPNAFLPDELQIEQKMPHANAARELDFFEAVLSRYKSCCSTLIYSTFQFDSERALNGSYFIDGPNIEATEMPVPDVDYFKHLFNRIPIVVVNDELVPVGKDERVSGGTTLLKNQAECAMKVVATQRIKIEKLQVPQEGLSPSDRGNLLHIALASFWGKLRTHSALMKMGENELRNSIHDATEEAFITLRGRSDIEPMLEQMEQQALDNNLVTWMEIEKSRKPFIVESIEAPQELRLAGKTVKMRLDRVDLIEDEDGNFSQRLLIDNKSSLPALSSLAKTRLTEPQLPMNALGLIQEDKNVDGIAYAVIRKNMNQLAGFSASTGIANGIKPVTDPRCKLPSSWDETITQWTVSLETLMQDYLRGTNTISPTLSGCQFCTHSLICRVDEM